MRGVALLSCLVAFLSAGCTVSVNPLASDDVVEFDEELVGTWVCEDPLSEPNEKDVFVFTARGKEYLIENRNLPVPTVVPAKLVRLGDTRILDMTYAKDPDAPSHHFLLLQGTGDSRTLVALDLRKIEQIVKTKEPTLSVAKPNDKWPLTHLDWSTEQLQGFFSRHGDAAFDNEYRGSMKKLPAPNTKSR